eukprot:symbB.v1.2.021545.t1/scaffold1866.1/size97981/3
MRQILMDHTMDTVGRRLFREMDGEAGAAAVQVAAPKSSQKKRNKAKPRGASKLSKDLKRNGKGQAADVSDSSSVDLRRWILSLKDEQLERLVDLLEQWNSNRRMAPLAQMMFAILLLCVPPAKLKAVEGMNATCRSVLSYATRHMARVDSLLQKTFLFDLILQSGSQGLAQESDATETSVEALKRTMDVLLQDQDEEEDDFEEDEAEEGAEDEASQEDVEEEVEAKEEAAEITVTPRKRRRTGKKSVKGQ